MPFSTMVDGISVPRDGDDLIGFVLSLDGLDAFAGLSWLARMTSLSLALRFSPAVKTWLLSVLFLADFAAARVVGIANGLKQFEKLLTGWDLLQSKSQRDDKMLCLIMMS